MTPSARTARWRAPNVVHYHNDGMYAGLKITQPYEESSVRLIAQRPAINEEHPVA